jgi:hypothetical protein
MDTKNLLDNKTLLAGGIKSGKTHYVCVFVEKILREGRNSILVLDFAPDLYCCVGGKMILSEHPRLHYLTTIIDAPRLRGKNDEDEWRLGAGNRLRIDALLDAHREEAADILVINDVTLYLQTGNHERLVRLMKDFPTVLINAYYGSDFPPSPLSVRERAQVESYMKAFDQIFFIRDWQITRTCRPGRK